MYTDPNAGSVLFQAFAAVLATVLGVLYVLSRQMRSRAARVRLLVRSRENERISAYKRNAGR